MTLAGQDILTKEATKNAPLRKAPTEWATFVQLPTTEWGSLDDVRENYLKTDGVKLKSTNVVTVFNIKGNDYRLLTWIDYDAKYVEVLEVLTHPEYNKNAWKDRH